MQQEIKMTVFILNDINLTFFNQSLTDIIILKSYCLPYENQNYSLSPAFMLYAKSFISGWIYSKKRFSSI
jgi:hypothetical protein